MATLETPSAPAPSPSATSALITAAERKGADEKETGRVEAFSDGVFAIAMTLLVINLLPLSVPGENQGDKLTHAWPTFFSFLSAFFTILVIWMNHHSLFTMVKRVDSKFLFLNGLLLLGTTFVPFPTALVAEHMLDGSGTMAAAIFAGTGLAIAGAFNGVWRYASTDRRLLGRDVTPEAIDRVNRGYWVGPVGYGAAFALAFASPVACVAVVTGLAIFYAIFA